MTPYPTRDELEKRGRERWDECVREAGLQAALEAMDQVGVPDPFVWHLLSCRKLASLGIALRIRVMEARP